MLEELLRTVRAEGALALSARGYAADRGTPWATARSLLTRLADAPGLAGLPPTALAQLAAVVPAIRHQFASLPDVAADEWAITEAVRLALEEVAAEVPVAVAVDDLPLADAGTRRLVLTVARRLPVRGLLLVVTARNEDLAAMPEAPPLLDVAGSHSISLRPLSLRETERLVWSMVPLAGPDRQALTERLHADTGGAPGHVVEWVEALVAEHALTPELDGRWRLAVDAGALSLPVRVREARARRESLDTSAATPADVSAGEVAAGGVPAAVAAPRSAGRKRRALALAAGLAGGIAAAIGMAAFAARAHGPRASGLDASLVAVAPFDAADPELGLWRQGVVDVLARHLDGAGPLRTVSPTVVVRRFAGHSDAASARALGERTNAGLVVYGGLVRAGPDSVRLDATLLDARRGRALGDVRVQGPLARMDRVLDSLSVALLRELARTRPVGAVRASGVASVPLPALEAFLAAEQHYRAGAYDSATADAERAVALDSTFALAWHRLGTLLQYGDDELTGARHLLRAGQLNRGLARRDSIIVALDSVRGAGDLAGLLAPREDVPTRFMETYLARVRQGTRLYPDDPELWYTLGEGLTHIGALDGATRVDQVAAYERAIALDSAFLPTYPHAVGALLATGNVARARHHLQTVRALARGERLRSAADIVLRVVRPDGSADTAAFDAWLQAAPLADFEPVWLFLDDWPDSTEVALRMLRVARRRAAAERPEMLAIVNPLLQATLGYRGHLAEQRALGATPAMVLQHAILRALPNDSARVAAAAWLRGGLPELSRPEPLVWFALQRDSVALTRYIGRVEAELGRVGARSAEQSDVARRARYGVGAARAYLRLARRDTVGALAELRQLSPRDCPANCTANQLLYARLLIATRALSEARAVLYRGSPGEGELPASAFDVLWQLERGRAAEEAEDLARAATAYTIAARAWARADPVLEWWWRQAEEGRRRVQDWMAARGVHR